MSNIQLTPWSQHCSPGIVHKSIYYTKRIFWIASLNDRQLDIMSLILTSLIMETFDLTKIYEVDMSPVRGRSCFKPHYSNIFMFKDGSNHINLEIHVDTPGRITFYFKSHNPEVSITNTALNYELFKKMFDSQIIGTIKKHNIDILKKESHT